MLGEIKVLKYQEAVEFLLPKHYSGRVPSISYAFGWIVKGELVAVCTFGKPASPPLCVGVCGKEYSDKVYELNRLCRTDTLKLQLSGFVSGCLRRLRIYDYIIVSYSDSEMNHHGYIYQACNFLYTGMTKERTDKYTEGNRHCRHYSNEGQGTKRKIRSAKHRYIFFATQDKRKKKEYIDHLKYSTQPYPKGNNSNYVLGEYLKPKVIDSGESTISAT